MVDQPDLAPPERISALIVDDEADIELLFSTQFRREIRSGKLALHFALDGDQALEFLDVGKHDVVLILSDINMPGMSGLELLRRIRERPSDLPVYLFTAYSMREDEALAAGASGFLSKPLDFGLLRQTLGL
jgi:CheY-like chemotaxis protein